MQQIGMLSVFYMKVDGSVPKFFMDRRMLASKCK